MTKRLNQKNVKNHNQFENKYYQEARGKVSKIHDLSLMKEIDICMEQNHNVPLQNTAKESGYSAYVIEGTINAPADADINPSLVKKRQVPGDSSSMIIERLKNAPTLPVSCLASAEHIVAMQNEVEDFVSEWIPSSKEQVMYQILAKPLDFRFDADKEWKHLLDTLLASDDTLKAEHISIDFNKKRKLFVIEISTQLCDIQRTLKHIKKINHFKIINCEFKDIGLNEGLLLVNRDASNPIHALANVANSDTQKGFVERDAGLTSGLKTHTYQDSNWTFNFYPNLEELQRRTGYTKQSYALKIHLKPEELQTVQTTNLPGETSTRRRV